MMNWMIRELIFIFWSLDSIQHIALLQAFVNHKMTYFYVYSILKSILDALKILLLNSSSDFYFLLIILIKFWLIWYWNKSCRNHWINKRVISCEQRPSLYWLPDQHLISRCLQNMPIRKTYTVINFNSIIKFFSEKNWMNIWVGSRTMEYI